MLDSQADQKSHHDKHCKKRQFKIGQQVSVQNYRGKPRWVPGTIIERTGPVSHQTKVGDKVCLETSYRSVNTVWFKYYQPN